MQEVSDRQLFYEKWSNLQQVLFTIDYLTSFTVVNQILWAARLSSL